MDFQVFYNETSQLFQYLKEHGLHDQSMHYRGLQESEGFDEQVNFIERAETKQQNEEEEVNQRDIISFQQYVYSIFWLSRENPSHCKKAFIQIVYFLLIGILEKRYLTYKLNSAKEKQQIKRLDPTYFVYFYLISLLGLFSIAFGYSFLFLSLNCYLFLIFNQKYRHNDYKITSLSEEIEQITNKMMAKIKQFKIQYVISQLNTKLINPKLALQKQHNLKNCLNRIQKIGHFQDSTKNTCSTIQDLYQFAVQIKERVASKSYSSSFLECSNIFYSKYLAFRAFIDLLYLKKVSQAIFNLEQNINLVSRQQKLELSKSVSKPQKQIYVKLLLNCIQKEKSNLNGIAQSSELKQLIELLRKEIQLQHLMNISQVSPQKNRKISIKQSQKEQNDAQIAKPSQIQSQSFYLSTYKDQKEEFIPLEKKEVINNLNSLFQKRQKSNNLPNESHIQKQEPQIPKKIAYEREIHPFGFKIVLPKRDMDAYYVE